jgi:3-mercaptopyruvate sulfurtransferase SseA
VALRFRELGMQQAFALRGGFGAWQDAGYPVEPLRRGDPQQNAAHHQPM